MGGQRDILGADDAKAHIVDVAGEGQRHQAVVAVAVGEDAAAGGHAVRVGDDVVRRGAVADGHHPVELRHSAHHRLLSVVVVAVGLGEDHVGVGVELLQTDGGVAGEGVPLAEKDAGTDVHQRLEGEVLFPEDTGDEVLGHVGDKDDAQRAAAFRHLVNDGRHLHLLEADLNVGLIQQVKELHERHGAEGVALGRHGQGGAVGGAAFAVIAGELAAALHQRGDLRHQIAPLLRQRDAAVGAEEYGDAQLPLHLRNSGG